MEYRHFLQDEAFVREAYGDDPRQTMLVRQPKDSARAIDIAMVWIHGGGWQGGAPEMLIPHIAYFADTYGVTGFSIGYRLLPDAGTVEGCLADCRMAVRRIRERYHPQRVIAGGESAGGYLACCLGDPSIVPEQMERADAVIGVNSVTDLTGKWIKGLYSEAEYSDMGDERAWEARYEHARALSPMLTASSGCAPAFIYHGISDTVTEPEMAMQYHRALRAQGVHTEIRLLPNTQHAFLIFDYNTPNDLVFRRLTELGAWLESAGIVVHRKA